MEEILNKILNTQNIILNDIKVIKDEQINMKKHFEKIDKKLEEHDRHFEKIDEKMDEIDKQVILIDYTQEQNTAKLLEGFNMSREESERNREEIRNHIRILENSLYRVEIQNINEHKMFKDRIKKLEKKII